MIDNPQTPNVMLFDLESGNRLDGLLFEIFLDMAGKNIPVRKQLVDAIRIVEEAGRYPIQRGYETSLSEEEVNEGTERLFQALKIELNK
jgi:hypothetical protein